MRWLGCWVAGALAVTCISACGLDGGGNADAPGAGDDDGGSSAIDGGGGPGKTDGSVGTDGAGTDARLGDDGSPPRDATGGGDAPPPPPPDSGPDACNVPEVCNNGVDDDCDGKIDCADPQCAPAAGWSCVAAAPPGWSIVSYETNGHDACAAGFGSPASVVEGPSSPPGACACGGCTVTDPGSCTKADFNYAVDGVVPCSIAGTLHGANGACTKLAQDYKTMASSTLKVSPAPWSGPGACSQVAGSPGAVQLAGQGETCALATTLGAGCGGGVCAPAGGDAFAVCVAQAGDVACPAGFAHKHLVGSSVNDARTCNACNCSVSATCTGAKQTLYTQDNCTVNGGGGQVSTVINADGQCDPVNDGNGQTYVAYTYSATVNPSCQSTGGGVAGTATLIGPQTVCCP